MLKLCRKLKIYGYRKKKDRNEDLLILNCIIFLHFQYLHHIHITFYHIFIFYKCLSYHLLSYFQKNKIYYCTSFIILIDKKVVSSYFLQYNKKMYNMKKKIVLSSVNRLSFRGAEGGGNCANLVSTILKGPRYVWICFYSTFIH